MSLRPLIIPVTFPFPSIPGVLHRIRTMLQAETSPEIHTAPSCSSIPQAAFPWWEPGIRLLSPDTELLFPGQRARTEVGFRIEEAHRRLFLVGKPKREAAFFFSSRKNKLRRIFAGSDASDFHFYFGLNSKWHFGPTEECSMESGLLRACGSTLDKTSQCLASPLQKTPRSFDKTPEP